MSALAWGQVAAERWLAVSTPDADLDPLALYARGGSERIWWEHPEGDEALAGLGAAAAVETAGPERFAEAAAAIERIGEAVVARGRAAGPLRWLGGFGFDDAPSGDAWRGFPPLRFVLPELLLHRRGATSRWTAVAPWPEGDAAEHVAEALLARIERARSALVCPDPQDPISAGGAVSVHPDAGSSDYEARVERILDAIGRGRFEKVVLARAVRVERPGGFRPEPLLARLRAAHPACASFAVTRAAVSFVGASPERLLRVATTAEGRRLDAAAVAGSAPRGRNPEEDARLARSLCRSEKEQCEHASVVRFLRERLAQACRSYAALEPASLLRLDGIQHLVTRFRGTLRDDASLLRIARRLHPTPAVAGAPQDASLAWLDRHEALDRGWYAGGVGHVDAAGDGELWVALRSALLDPKGARLFAGAGVVAGSESAAELRETRLKLAALLTPLLEI